MTAREQIEALVKRRQKYPLAAVTLAELEALTTLLSELDAVKAREQLLSEAANYLLAQLKHENYEGVTELLSYLELQSILNGRAG